MDNLSTIRHTARDNDTTSRDQLERESATEYVRNKMLRFNRATIKRKLNFEVTSLSLNIVITHYDRIQQKNKITKSISHYYIKKIFLTCTMQYTYIHNLKGFDVSETSFIISIVIIPSCVYISIQI